MADKILILTGGTLKEEFLQSYLELHRPDKIICVDGALQLVDKMKIPVDFLVGDFDSAPKKLVERYIKEALDGGIKTQVRRFQAEKDDTDTQIAISLAVELNVEEVVILGATGTRIDHMLANIHLLYNLLKKGVRAFIIDENNRIYLRNSSFCLKKCETYGSYISLLPFGKSIKRVTLNGFKYNTREVDFNMGESLGVSNQLLLEEGNVNFSEGIFIVIESND